MEELFQAELLKDEKISWVSQPEPKAIFCIADIFLIPFSVMWGGFAIFWEASVLSMKAPGFFALFGIPFVVIGLYFIFGRFFYKMYRKRKTYYAITNRRVLILTDLFNRNLQAEFIEHIPCMNKNVRANGIGTIKFGNSSFTTSMYGNTGMELFGSMYGKDVPTFYDVHNVDEVYKKINDLRHSN